MAGQVNLKEKLEKLLGYLNFSEGRPDPGFQKTLAEVCGELESGGATEPWRELRAQLGTALTELKTGGSGAFRDAAQASAVLTLTFDKILPAYREHHADLLFHIQDVELFQPFFVARVMETVLALQPAQRDSDQLISDALKQLNDYVGHRPIAVLESRPKGEPYDHERVRPVPLYIKGAGVAPGKYSGLVQNTLEILQNTDASVLADAHFSLDQMDELAFDPRAYDHGHPANRRPNYVFGEWDPHLIDNKGRYRRMVVRRLILEAILARMQQQSSLPLDELLFESGSVLAGTILMASGVSGSGPDTHDSSVTLATLVPGIARYRDAFYTNLLKTAPEKYTARLRREMEVMLQPFAGARQYLNQFLARHRAAQLQQRHLALVMAELGYPEASRKQALRIPAASGRLLSEIHIRLTSGQVDLDYGRLEQAAAQLTEIEDLLHRGIACGALADPWNILGFGGLYPIFQAMEDSAPDPRIDDLVDVVEQTFDLYACTLAETAASGNTTLANRLTANMHELAGWWDRFATYEVSDVHPVEGREAASSAEHVAKALRLWHERGGQTADLAFWREHLEGFQSPKAYALVVDALLNKEDYRAAMGLLMHWLSRFSLVPLEDGHYSFHTLALRWMLGYCQENDDAEGKANPADTPNSEFQSPQSTIGPPELVVKFFDYLEANAEDYWSVPQLDIVGIPIEQAEGEALAEIDEDDEEDEIFEAAYEGVIFEDSTDDDIDMEVLDVGPEPEFDLEIEGRRIEAQLRFLSTVARMWTVAVRLTCIPGAGRSRDETDPTLEWLKKARDNYKELLELMDDIHSYLIPQPTGSHDSLVEFDRRRVIKERLLHDIIGTCLATWLSVAILRSRRGKSRKVGSWKTELILLEEALWKNDFDLAKQRIPVFLEKFKIEPMLYTPLSHDGKPRQILRATRAQTILRDLAANLPRLGLLNETIQVVQAGHEMERRQQLGGHRITEFARLFQIGCQSIVEAIVESDAGAKQPDEAILLALERAVLPLLPIWRDHSKTLRIATLEIVTSENEWSELCSFIQRYGRDVFHVRFMAIGNLRGILQQGVGEYLEYLSEESDPMNPIRLVEDLDRDNFKKNAERRLEIILQTVIENYDAYKDYNTTATQSDYGENLYILLDFLRLKARYDRQAWYFRPLIHVHEVLARRRPSAASAWQEKFQHATQTLAERYVNQLEQLERAHGVRLTTVRDLLEERFVKPLTLDRLCALIEPAMNAAGGPDADETLATLEEQLLPVAENPTGVGLDVPQWLQRIEATIDQVNSSRSAIAELAESLLQVHRTKLSLNDLQSQLPAHDGASVDELWNAMIAALGQVGGG